ncbi:hypothetical protein BgAZ_404390 [Babesia gibsoni]|uniref:BRCT domain-containing protein n=1 Tax=Babesia gibsoni TaxID=33632 RepID=A0AAD8LHP8_BABGI|nr:hypothetical protein BgAZ_404390 [Babesia gibsoni]
MPLPYCCHIISSIELIYSAERGIPKRILRAFRHPRVDSNNVKTRSNSGESGEVLSIVEDDFVVCNRILESHGFQLVPNEPDGAHKDGTLRIERVEKNGSITGKRSRSEGAYPAHLSRNSSLDIGKHPDSVEDEVLDIIRRSMVYYICLFDDYSQDFQSLTSVPNVSNETCSIRKHSVYEMLCAVKDCISQLRRNSSEYMEAVLITDDYSGIFTNEEVLIARSSMAFRSLLSGEGIRCTTIHDDISSYGKPLSEEENPNEDELVNEYLKPFASRKSWSQKSTSFELAIVDCTEKPTLPDRTNMSKFDLFKSLNLPISGDGDMNLFSVRGRSNCQKLLNFLEKQCTENILKMKSRKLKVTPVKFVLANFPVVFSKIQEVRVSSHENSDDSKEKSNRLSMKGLILPCVLNNMLKVVRRMQLCDMLSGVSMNVDYNAEIDSALHDTTFQISERNTLYQSLISNLGLIDRSSQSNYRLLRKMLPLRNFIIQRGKVSISSKGILKKQTSLTLSQHSREGDFGGKVMCLADIVRNGKYYRDSAHSSDYGVVEDLVILKDTLYGNLSGIMFTTIHLEGGGVIATMPTKTLVDESLSNVCCADLDSAHQHPHSLKCYVDLYPMRPSSRTQSVMEVVNPHQLVNLVWLMNYLLHVGGFVPFVDKESYIGTMTDHIPDAYNQLSFLSLSRSFAEDSSRMTDGDTLQMFSVDVTYTRNDPLAQQSYILMLVNHIRFNKRFKNAFGVSYMEYSKERLQKMHKKDHKGEDSWDASRSDSAEKARSGVPQLARSWNSLMQRVQSDANLGDMMEPQAIDNVGEELRDVMEDMNSQDVDMMNYTLPPPNVTMDNKPRPSGFLNMFQTITDEEISALNISNDDKFQSVSSAGRAHGRVHHCIFDFDTKVPFKDKDERSKFQKEMEKMYIPPQKNKSISVGKKHKVFVFITSKMPTSLECSRIKLIKDLINSSYLTFIQQEKPEVEMEYNLHNAEAFIRQFKSECVANSIGEYYTKAGVSYSFVINVERLERHLSRMFHLLGEGVKYDIYYTSIDMHQSEDAAITHFRENRMELNAICAEKAIKEHYVNYSWLCDSYFKGAIDFKSDIRDYHKLNLKGEKKHHSSKDLKDKGNQANKDGDLTFNEIYQEVKFFWGWHVYVLDGERPSISSHDVSMYRKHCGIHMKSYRSLSDIETRVTDGIRFHLKRYRISEEDVSTFMTHHRIYTNTVVLLGDHISGYSATGDLPIELADCGGCTKPMLGGKVICCGRYDGIPLLKPSWLISSLRNGKTEPMESYIVK